jgi:sulfate/thiosulfate transport system substrate-binding protein
VNRRALFELINWRLVCQRVSIVVILAGVVLYTIWPWIPGIHATPTRTLVLYGFSILGEVMNDGVFPAFEAEWRRQRRESVQFISSFAGSGTITNQMILGVPAEVAILSLELDGLRLAEAGVLAGETWRSLPHSGVLNRTPFIILVRPGNPKGIRDFADLTRPGIQVVHPDPLTSGGANWAIVAEYGAAARHSSDPAEAGYRLLLGIWRNVVAQAASARAARTQFENGFGDALITYEQEALRDQARGRLRSEIVYPRSTIYSEHTVVVLDKNIDSSQRELVDAFVSFLWSEPSQAIFVKYGFRSVDEALSRANPSFGQIEAPFLINDFGGWPKAKREIVDGIWKRRVLKEIGQ